MISFTEVVSVEPDLIRISTKGKYVFDEMFQFLARVKEMAEKEKKTNILIDSRQLEGTMTEAERFQGGVSIAQVFGSRFRVALLIPPEKITKLGELTAVNRGAKFTVVSSATEALDFLKRAR